MGVSPKSPRTRKPWTCEWSNKDEALAAFEGHGGKTSPLTTAAQRQTHDTPRTRVGDLAPDSKVVALLDDDDENVTRCEMTNLHSIIEKDPRPAVLVLGSITCPSFRRLFLKEIVDIIQEQKGAIRLLVVYLAEAHPKDGDWHLHHDSDDEKDLAVHTHKTIEERIAAAQLLLKLYDPQHVEEIVVDTMDNDTDHQYEAQPSRVFVIHDKKIVYQSEVGPGRISPSSLQAFLWEWKELQK